MTQIAGPCPGPEIKNKSGVKRLPMTDPPLNRESRALGDLLDPSMKV
jgi:hypothetical protein